jgi:methyl-accepting chemotaxis protein
MSSAVAELKAVNAAQVCLILGLALILAGSVVGLAAMGKDVVTILTGVAAVAITVAGAFGWAKANQLVRNFNQVSDSVDQVRELSNGRLTEVLEENKRLNDKVTALAMLVQPPEPK